MLLRILGAWCKSPNKRILSYKDALQQTECESIETTVRTRRLLWAGALLRMGDHRVPKGSCRESPRTRGNVGRGGRRKSRRTAWQMIFGYLASRGTGAPPHLTLGHGITVHEGGCRFMAAWVKEEENESNQRQKKREAEEADNVEVAPGVTVASLRRFRAALIGPTQGLSKRRRLCR